MNDLEVKKVKENVEIIEKVGEVLCSTSRPLKERFRALFTLRNIGGSTAIKCIEKGFDDSSALLKHECAYCLGQMKDPLAIPKLTSVLQDLDQEPIVRHEAAEALAAIGKRSAVPDLVLHVDDPSQEVAETCSIALQKLSDDDLKDVLQSPYNSVDPTPPLPKARYKSITDLKNILLDESQSLYSRYQAMFTLRNIGTSESALAIAEGLTRGSPLFRHEVAFVLGQIQDPSTVEQLIQVLENENEHEMVRHECAEALGAIATDKCMKILVKYLKDNKRVVRESCEVAVDMCEYENSLEFQYADALLKIRS